MVLRICFKVTLLNEEHNKTSSVLLIAEAATAIDHHTQEEINKDLNR